MQCRILNVGEDAMPTYGNPASVSAYAISAVFIGWILYLIMSNGWFIAFGRCDLIKFVSTWFLFASEGLLLAASIYSTFGISMPWPIVIGGTFALTGFLRLVLPRQ